MGMAPTGDGCETMIWAVFWGDSKSIFSGDAITVLEFLYKAFDPQ